MKLPQIISILLANLVTNFSFSTVYNSTANGNWTAAVWSPAVPPSPLAGGDVVNVLHNITLNTHITFNGNLNIHAAGNLNGAKNITINATGNFQNNGTVSIDHFTNHGNSENNNSFTSNSDLTNDGNFINNVGGTISVLSSKDFDNDNGTLTNHGTMNIDHDLKNDNGNITNNGILNVNHNWDNKNGNSTNNGTVHIVHDLVNNPGTFTNNGSVTVDNIIRNNGGTLNGTGGSYIVDNHIDNNSGTITGSITVCDNDGISNPIINGGFVGGSVVICFSILPIELISFNAEQKNNLVEIYWQMASEKNYEKYVVEKSLDGNNFVQLDLKKSNRQTQNNSYSSLDEKLHDGVVYYRLRQIRTDASYLFSDVVTVRVKTNQVELNIFPNPLVRGENLYFHTASNSKEILITVLDFTGKTIFSKIIFSENNGVLVANDLSGKLIPGIYFITGTDGNNVLLKQKLIISELSTDYSLAKN